ncbi:MAG: type II toxin-antitoxin system HicB family antitoxin [Alphaproteobacteria bacterium]|nr:type II toxin-antitoxin system HicB family antitoxin [Alphaproteobacteria bacterium]
MGKTKKKTRKLTALVAPDSTAGYLALNPETDTCTQGRTVEEALANLQEATELYLEDSLEDCPRKFAVKSITVEVFGAATA